MNECICTLEKEIFKVVVAFSAGKKPGNVNESSDKSWTEARLLGPVPGSLVNAP